MLARCRAGSRRTDFAPEDAGHFGAPEQQKIERNFRDLARRKADDEKPPLPRERANERLRGFAADAVVNDIGAVAAGQCANVGFEIGAWKDDRIVGTGSFRRWRTFRPMTRRR